MKDHEVMRLYYYNQGVGLVEVLITLLIVSVGVLNMAALQTTAKKSNFDAVQRTTGVLLASDILERMRANPVTLANYLTNSSGLGGGTLSTPSQTCILTSKCSTSELAAYDLWAWEQAVDGASETRSIGGTTTQTGGLVNPTACITGPAIGGAGIYTVTLTWRGLNELSNISTNTCGLSSGKYGTNDENRRILSLTTYISP